MVPCFFTFTFRTPVSMPYVTLLGSTKVPETISSCICSFTSDANSCISKHPQSGHSSNDGYVLLMSICVGFLTGDSDMPTTSTWSLFSRNFGFFLGGNKRSFTVFDVCTQSSNFFSKSQDTHL